MKSEQQSAVTDESEAEVKTFYIRQVPETLLYTSSCLIILREEERSCTIPEGKSQLISPIEMLCTPADPQQGVKTEDEMRQCAKEDQDNREDVLKETVDALEKAQNTLRGSDTKSENSDDKVRQNDSQKYDDMLRNLRQRLEVAGRCGEPNYNRSPDLTSISVELTLDLIRSILSIDKKIDLDPKFRNKINTEIRVPMEEKYGITIPSIKFKDKRGRVSWLLCRLNPDKHAYSIKFRETIVDQGRTSLDIDLVVKRLKKVIEDNVAEFI